MSALFRFFGADICSIVGLYDANTWLIELSCGNSN